MFQSIVVPLDGSRFGEAALPTAVRIAEQSKAQLTLLTVHQPLPITSPAAEFAVVGGPGEEAIRTRVEQYVTDTAARLGRVGAGPAAARMEVGHPGVTVANFVATHRPDLVVMTTHGRGPLSRFWLGSVADYVVRHVERPVLLIRPPAEGEGEPSSAPITSVLVPLDYSKESQEIIGSAVSLAEVDGASLTLMMVVIPVVGMADGAFPYLIPIDPGALDDYRRQAETYLEGLAGAWRGKGLTIETKVVVGVSPTDGILEELKRPEYGVCAMATHVGRGIERMALGSVADKIIRSSEKPVLVMRTHHVEHR